jgi:molybdopterin-guanine dinucleotide biosynthesis protein A
MTPAKQYEWTGLSGVVLAGGQSKRMGRDKALLELGGRTLIARVLDKLALLCDELIISANERDPYTHLAGRVVPDVIPGRGALGGIHAGLAAMRNERAVVVACDMPFLNVSFLRFLAAISPGFDVVVPRLGPYYEPLHAVYGRNCVTAIERVVADGPQRVVALFEGVRVSEVPEEQVRLYAAERSFLNVNTPADWAEVQRLSTCSM